MKFYRIKFKERSRPAATHFGGSEMTSPWMTIEEAAQYSRLTVSTLRKYTNQILGERATRRVLFTKEQLDTFLTGRIKVTPATVQSRFQSAKARVRSLTTDATAIPLRKRG